MSLVGELMAVHADALEELQGDRFLYVRAAGGNAILTLIRGTTDHESRTPDGAVVTVRTDDWLVRVTDFRGLAAFRDGAVPEDDDKIRPLRPGSNIPTGRTYRVKPINGESCYRTQPGGLMFRIHTKDEGHDA